MIIKDTRKKIQRINGLVSPWGVKYLVIFICTTADYCLVDGSQKNQNKLINDSLQHRGVCSIRPLNGGFQSFSRKFCQEFVWFSQIFMVKQGRCLEPSSNWCWTCCNWCWIWCWTCEYCPNKLWNPPNFTYRWTSYIHIKFGTFWAYIFWANFCKTRLPSLYQH